MPKHFDFKFCDTVYIISSILSKEGKKLSLRKGLYLRRENNADLVYCNEIRESNVGVKVDHVFSKDIVETLLRLYQGDEGLVIQALLDNTTDK